MILSRLRLKRFMRFDDLELLLKPGLNLIVGSNESGKSTIVEALGIALFVDPATTSKSVHSLEAWGSAGGMELELDFEHGGTEYRLLKHFGEGRAELSGGGEQLSDRSAVAHRIAEMVGFGSREAFESVAMVRQGELAAFEGQSGKGRRAELVPMIERKMTSASGRVDAQAVVNDLRDVAGKLRVGMDRPAKRPGRLRELLDERDKLTKRIAEVGQRWGVVLSRRAAHARRRQEWQVTKDERDRLARIVGEQEALLDMSSELERVEEELTRAEATIGRVRQLRSDHADALGEKDSISEADAERVRSSQAELEATERIVADFRAESSLPENANSSRTGLLAFMAGAVAVIGIPVTLFLMNGLVASGISGAVAAVFAVIFIILFRRFGALREYERDLGNLMRDRGKRELALQAALMQVGVPSFAEFSRLYEDQDKRWQRAEIARTRLAEICESQDPEDFEQELQTRAVTLGRRRSELTAEIEGSGGAKTVLAATEVAKLRDDLETKREQEKQLHETLAREEGVLERDEEGESLPDLEARLESVLQEIGGIERRLAVMDCAAAGLEQALATTKEEAAEVLAPIVTRVLSRITAGRYAQVTLSRDLEIGVDNPSDRPGAPQNVLQGDLSTGTVDQLYLAMRYALLEFLSDVEGAPFILDDVFVNFDPTRRMRGLKLLREFSDERQVIACMCEDHGAEQPVNLIRLNPI